MSMIKRFVSPLSVAGLFLAIGMTQAMAQQTTTLYTCMMADRVRNVELRENPGGQPVCEVWYDKTQEGAGRSLIWSANNDLNYCSERTAAFLNKFIVWGWTCTEDSAMPEETDDPGN